MRPALTCCLMLWALVAMLVPRPSSAAVFGMNWEPNPHGVATLVAPLQGDPRLSEAVSTIFDFQIWATLDARPADDPSVLAGLIGWNDAWEPPTNTASALALARERRGQLILWGRVQRYGDEVLALPRLSLAPAESDVRRVQPEIWTIRLQGKTVRLDVPRTTYDLGVVRLDPEFVSNVSGPSMLVLCRGMNADCDGGPVGRQFVLISQAGEWSKVVLPRGRSGWVRIPRMAEAPPIVGLFSGGMIAYFRGDFERAAPRFEAAIEAQALGPQEELNTLALAVSARARSGQDTAQLRRRMLELDPYSPYAAKVVVMDRLEAAARATDPNGRRAFLSEAASRLAVSRDLFDTDDPWVAAARAVANGP